MPFGFDWPDIQPPDINIDLPPIDIGSGSTNERATALVNSAELRLQANLAAYQQGRLSQTQALNVFDTTWQAVVQGCTQLQNRRCIPDRDRGGPFDWFAAYRDPISGTPGSGGRIPYPDGGGYPPGGGGLPPVPPAGISVGQILLYAVLGLIALKALKIL